MFTMTVKWKPEKIHKTILKKILIIVWILMISGVFAQEQINPMALPKLTQRVTDFSQTLPISQLDELNAIAKDYESRSTNQLVTVIFPQRNGNELIDIGMKIFSDNGIGRKDVNNGLLLLISSEEKKIRIIVWYGLEGVYPDLMASQVIENDIRPLVNSGDFVWAIRAFYSKSEQIIWGEIPAWYSDDSDDSFYIFLFVWFILWYILRVTRVFSKIKNHAVSSRRNYWIFLLIGVFSILILSVFVGAVLYIFIGLIMWLLGIRMGGKWGWGFGWWGFGWWGFGWGGGGSGWWGAGD